MTGTSLFLRRLRVVLLTALIWMADIDTKAQNETVKSANGSELRYNHLIGVQLNELIRQVFNYEKNAATNPYQLTYSLTSAKTNWGLRTGIGVNYSNIVLNGDYMDTTQKSLSVQFRVGVEKSFKLYRRFIVGVGLDFVYDHRKSENIETENQPTVSHIPYKVDNTLTTELFGGGPELSLKYQISNRIAVGTELELYYITGTERNKTVYQYTSAEESEKTSIDQKNLNTPTVFYLIIRL
jgi:hypothetical protein